MVYLAHGFRAFSLSLPASKAEAAWQKDMVYNKVALFMAAEKQKENGTRETEGGTRERLKAIFPESAKTFPEVHLTNPLGCSHAS